MELSLYPTINELSDFLWLNNNNGGFQQQILSVGSILCGFWSNMRDLRILNSTNPMMNMGWLCQRNHQSTVQIEVSHCLWQRTICLKDPNLMAHCLTQIPPLNLLSTLYVNLRISKIRMYPSSRVLSGLYVFPPFKVINSMRHVPLPAAF